MKYPQLVSMPSAISDWLEEQLEARGIDAVVYTRYVLSLLYRDPSDIICDQEQEDRSGGGGGGGRKRLCRASYYAHHHWAHADAERLQRSAAVECLKSASDQKCGIESLVDELCAKLKDLQQRSLNVVPDVEQQQQQQQQQPGTKEVRHKHHFGSGLRSKPVRIPRKHAERDSARRYYAAFPALTADSSPQLVHVVPKWLGSPKRRLVARKPDMEIKPALGKYRKNKPKTGLTTTLPKAMAATKMAAEVCVDDDDEMYDLPLLDDIRELLESTSPSAGDAAMLRATPSPTAFKSSKFLQCGTNIISSIWSTTEETSRGAGAGVGGGGGCDYGLDVKFGNIAIGWSSWSDHDFEREHLIAQSLLKLNHTREGSGFTEVQPRVRSFAGLSPPAAVAQLTSGHGDEAAEEEDGSAKEEDLLHSARSHFKPISECCHPAAEEAHHQPRYVDGTTFAIHANLDVVAFERSASGTMYLQEVVGSSGSVVGGGGSSNKRYLEYKREHAFNVKFNVNPNDKGCQTDDDSVDDAALSTPPAQQATLLVEPTDHQRPDSTMAELFSEGGKCANCCVSAICTPPPPANIWNGEICMGCLQLSTSDAAERIITPLQERRLLREDIQVDGERLLSDLSTLQQAYMDDDQPQECPAALQPSAASEACCDIAALICADGGGGVANVGGAVRKLRVPIHSASFSFATRLQQDCLLKMATIPTLRSVTL